MRDRLGPTPEYGLNRKDSIKNRNVTAPYPFSLGSRAFRKNEILRDLPEALSGDVSVSPVGELARKKGPQSPKTRWLS